MLEVGVRGLFCYSYSLASESIIICGSYQCRDCVYQYDDCKNIAWEGKTVVADHIEG